MLRAALNYPSSRTAGSRAVVLGGVSYLLLSLALLIGSYASSIQEIDTSTAVSELGSSGQLGVLVVLVLGQLLVYLLTRGYFVAVLGRLLAGESTPPAFSPAMFLDGAKVTLITLAYLLPGTVAIVVAVTLRSEQPASSVGAFTNAVGSMLVLCGLFWTLIAIYLLPAALALFAHTDSMNRAFAWRVLVKCVTTEDYAVGRIGGAFVRLCLFPVALVLQLLFVGFFLRFHVHVSGYYLYGRAIAVTLE
ncbi:DUF4013 domain-containing protein [Halocatena halophila]|uniref:DUF4013 domain-containing protein n=1 Tax=Halocatena halophila TaxID=2814576 RepID=UPI002ED5F6CE